MELKRHAGARLFRVWWALVGSWNFILGAMGFGYGLWRAFCFCVQIFFIPASLYVLEGNCGCQTEVGEAVGHLYLASLGVGKASLPTRWDWRGIWPVLEFCFLFWQSGSQQEEAHGMMGKGSPKVKSTCKQIVVVNGGKRFGI